MGIPLNKGTKENKYSLPGEIYHVVQGASKADLMKTTILTGIFTMASSLDALAFHHSQISASLAVASLVVFVTGCCLDRVIRTADLEKAGGQHKDDVSPAAGKKLHKAGIHLASALIIASGIAAGCLTYSVLNHDALPPAAPLAGNVHHLNAG